MDRAWRERLAACSFAAGAVGFVGMVGWLGPDGPGFLAASLTFLAGWVLGLELERPDAPHPRRRLGPYR